jgi:hypothetical protein
MCSTVGVSLQLHWRRRCVPTHHSTGSSSSKRFIERWPSWQRTSTYSDSRTFIHGEQRWGGCECVLEHGHVHDSGGKKMLSHDLLCVLLTFECTYLCVWSWFVVRTRLDLYSSMMHRKWRIKYLHNHTDVTARIWVPIVLTSCRTSGLGRRTYRTPPGIDLDVLFCWTGLVFGCYIVIKYCYIVM